MIGRCSTYGILSVSAFILGFPSGRFAVFFATCCRFTGFSVLQIGSSSWNDVCLKGLFLSEAGGDNDAFVVYDDDLFCGLGSI